MAALFGAASPAFAQSPWEPIGLQPTASRDSMFFDTASGRVVNYDPSTGDTWAWDGQRWRTIGSGGPVLSVVAIAYDEVRSRAVMFEGATGTTWEWNGTVWSAVNTNASLVRSGTALTFDPNTGGVILHGGGKQTTQLVLLDDTWSWNGSQWTLLGRTGPAVQSIKMSREPGTNRVLGYGGSRGLFGSLLSTETWAWDGTTWTQLAVSGPPGTQGAMVTDTVRNRIVLSVLGPNAFGGRETWEWTGTGWVLASPAGGSLSFPFTNMAFDRTRGEAVGLDGAGTWLWNGTLWTLTLATPPDPSNVPILVHNPRSGTNLLIAIGGRHGRRAAASGPNGPRASRR